MSAEYTGWLLDVYDDTMGQVKVWLLSDDGQRLLLSQKLPVRFYASGPENALR